MTPLFCPAQALVLFWLHKLVQGANPFGRENKYSHCLRPFQQQTHYICSGKSWKTTWSVQLGRKKFCLEGAMCAICSPFAGELPKELRHQGQTSAPSLKGTAHTTGAAAVELQSSPPPKPRAAWAPRGFRITQDIPGVLWQWQKLHWAANYLHCAPAVTHLLYSRDLPYHLHLCLSRNHFFLRKLYVLVISPWLKNWSRSLNMTLFRLGKQQGSAHLAFLTFPR